RSVLPELGLPGSSREYLERQGAVLDLISFIAIPLIRNCVQDSRGVAVLTEIGEGCLDPLLKKKFSVYAQELLAKSGSGAGNRPCRRWNWSLGLLGLGGAALLPLYLASPGSVSVPSRHAAAPALAVAAQPAAVGPEGAGTGRVRAEPEAAPLTQPAAEVKGGASPGEQTTKVRISNNQILVPVMIKNDGESIRVDLVLDTGSSRTAIHEELATRLRIDLRLAKASQSEVADGRVIRSRIATIDSLGVGPFAMTSAEVELIPYKGTEGVRDGLLGMDFLGKHRYQIDMEHELIRWF
ncbi:MAG TPA: retropepsin-like aspartic protease, partial [Geomonas sp.]